nr:transketolase C-terminal domain-containing protein [Propioniciclava coleopterorum]
MTVVVPADPAQTAAVLRWAHGHDGPVYVRIAREPVPAIFDTDHVFRPGRVDVVREGSDVTLVANGIVLHRTLAAAEALAAEGVEARVLAAASVKPLDDAAILAAARETGAIVTVEEGYAAGGLGGAVSELVAREASAPVRVLGFGDAFAATGSVDWLLAQAGLTPAGIAAAARDLLRVAA